MHGWPNHTIKMKNRKETIEIEIALIDKKSSYITRSLATRLLQSGGLASHSHEKLYTSEVNRRKGWMTSSKKWGNG